MQRVRMSMVAVALIAAMAAGVDAQTRLTTINGSPLRINVGADGSFQVYNDAVPGVGQVFPTGAALADMGLFARIDGALFAPNFNGHGGGTATGNLTSYTPWTSVGISPRPVGFGTAESPFIVSVGLAAPGTDVRVNMTVTYVNGNNFFRVQKHFYSTTETTHEIDAFFGADIYLGGSDNGIFVSVPQLAAVGGRNCDPAEGAYNILLIPITPATRFTAAHYADVWAQIQANELDNNSSGAACIDNGAAVQWNDIMRGSSSVALSTAVSFGEIPSPSNFHGFMLDIEPDFVVMSPGESTQLTVTSRRNPELGFDAPIAFSAPALPPGMTIVFDPAEVPAPGDGTVTATLTLGREAFPRVYETVGIFGSGGNETRGAFFGVDVLCTPPFILGISQPKTQVVKRGETATIRVVPGGGGLFSYQWYEGHAPLTFAPIADSDSPELVTGPVNRVSAYWVRITNQCGSTDSLTAMVIPTN